MNPILLDIPTSFETTNLLIRKSFPGDGEEIFSFLSTQDNSLSVEDTEYSTRLSHIQFLSRENLLFHIYLKESSIFVGIIEITPINWDIPYIQIQYSLDKKFSEQGYELESILATKYYATHILQARRIEMQCSDSNIVTRKLIEDAGFRLEGILSNHQIDTTTKEITHTCIYTI